MASFAISETDKVRQSKTRRYVEMTDLIAFVWLSVTVNNMAVGLLSALFISQSHPASREILGSVIAAVLLASVISFALFMFVFSKIGKEKQ